MFGRRADVGLGDADEARAGCSRVIFSLERSSPWTIAANGRAAMPVARVHRAAGAGLPVALRGELVRELREKKAAGM